MLGRSMKIHKAAEGTINVIHVILTAITRWRRLLRKLEIRIASSESPIDDVVEHAVRGSRLGALNAARLVGFLTLIR